MSGATQMLGIGQLRLWIENHCLFLFAFAIIVSNFTWLMNFQRKLHITWKGALLIAALHNIIGYSAMKALAIIETGGNIDQAADMRLFGAIFILPAFYALVGKYTKSDSAVVMDIAAVCLVIGLICGRLNCLCSGCCFGSKIPGLESMRWPLREVELIFYFSFLAIFCKKILNGQTFGQIYPRFMMVYGGLRFVLEWVRVEYTTRVGIFHLAHIWALISFAAGASMYYELQERERRGK